MGKTLSESAAEILNASMSNAGREAAQKMVADIVDLGGPTPTDSNDLSSGLKTAANAKQVAPPSSATPGDKAFGSVKYGNATAKPNVGAVGTTLQGEETSADVNLADLSEEELDELLSNLSEEELAALEEELDMLDEEEVIEEDTIDEEGNCETSMPKGKKMAKKSWKMEAVDVKELVKSNMGSMLEDVDALFNGESLSEEFRTKAATIVEAAVRSRVEAVVTSVMAKNEELVYEQVESIRSELAEQVDTYMNYVVEQWMEENQVAIETGIRAEVVEGFMTGLKNLFAEHYIDVPADKADLVEELASRVVALEESAEDAAAVNASLTEELNVVKKNEAIRKICEGLTEVQINKMISLAEGVEFTTEGEFNGKLAVIRENYFPTKKILSEVAAAEGTPEEPEVDVSSIMAHYVKAISKQLPN